MEKIIQIATEYLPLIGLVSVSVIAAIVAILRHVALKKGPENTRADEVADKLEKGSAYIEDLTDGHPDIDLNNDK